MNLPPAITIEGLQYLVILITLIYQCTFSHINLHPAPNIENGLQYLVTLITFISRMHVSL